MVVDGTHPTGQKDRFKQGARTSAGWQKALQPGRLFNNLNAHNNVIIRPRPDRAVEKGDKGRGEKERASICLDRVMESASPGAAAWRLSSVRETFSRTGGYENSLTAMLSTSDDHPSTRDGECSCLQVMKR